MTTPMELDSREKIESSAKDSVSIDCRPKDSSCLPDGKDAQDVYQQFSVDIERIKVQFSKLTTAVGKSIANHVELIAHVLSMGILSGRDEDDMLLANSTSDAMVVLTKYLSFIDHQPLESIIDTMCGDAERQMLLIYCEDLKEFCQRRVRIAAPTATDVEHADKESIHILFDLNDPVLRCVKNLRVSIANILECPASAIVLHGIRDSGKVVQGYDKYFAGVYCMFRRGFSDPVPNAFDLVITPHVEAHVSAVKKEYHERMAELCCGQVIEFDDGSDRITVEIPLEGISIGEDWRIIPLTRPVVLKQAVDEYKVGEIIPTLSFSVIYLKEDKHLNAKCSWVQKQLELIGAKFPSNVLTLDIRQPRFTTVQRLRSEEKLNDLLERVLSREGSTEALHSATRLLSKPEAETRPKEPQSETRSEQGGGAFGAYGISTPSQRTYMYGGAPSHKPVGVPYTSGQAVRMEKPWSIPVYQTMMQSHRTGLRGVDVCGVTRIRVNNSAQLFEWERYGLKVNIEKNSLPAATENMMITIEASIAGHYESPADYDRASAVFWFKCEPNVTLEKSINVEIQHCATSDDTLEMSFGRAVCTQAKLPYTFELLDGGQFNSQSSYGVLALSRFSGIAAFFKRYSSVRRKYYASLFHLTKEPNHEIHVVVTWNTDTHLEVVREKYSNAQPGPEQQILFESDKISLNIPREGIDVPYGWRIIPLKNPLIMKADVDGYRPGQGIPTCHLLARIEDRNSVAPLEHRITLEGAKPPNTFFTIFIDPEAQHQPRLAPSYMYSSAGSTSVIYPSVDSSAVLDENDFADVFGDVSKKKASYFALGRGLRIPSDELDTVHTLHCSNLDMALSQVLLLWLRQRYDVKRFGRPTWRMLVEAVGRRAGMNDHALAQEIAQKHRRRYGYNSNILTPLT